MKSGKVRKKLSYGDLNKILHPTDTLITQQYKRSLKSHILPQNIGLL